MMDIKWTGKNQLRALWMFQHVLVFGLVVSYWVAADKIKSSRFQFDLIWCSLLYCGYAFISYLCLFKEAVYATPLLFGSMIGYSFLLSQLALLECIRYSGNGINALSSVSVFSGMIFGCFIFLFTGIIYLKDEFLQDIDMGSMPGQGKQREMYPPEQA